MSGHARQQILAAMQARLTGLPRTGGNLFIARRADLAAAQLPALRLEAGPEQSALHAGAGQPRGIGPARLLARQVDIRVEVVAQDSTAVPAALDAIAADVETAVGSDPTLGGRVIDTVLVGSDPDYTATGEHDGGTLVLNFRVNYHTRENNPTTLITGD